jgi:GT2 family glycosyltransferase
MERSSPDVTICVVPRERYSCAIDSLENIVRNSDGPYKLVYVDGNSPTAIATQLAQLCRAGGFTYLREDCFLTPNRARNIGLKVIDTAYVAFVDNDLFVQPGWLQPLVECARQTGAWAVGPVVLEGSENLSVIHMAGGDLVEERSGGYNRVKERHRYMYQTLASVRQELVREPVGSFEFHCVLVKTGLFGQRCFLDEGFLSHQEHLDLAREIRLAGGEVYFEPRSVVRYDNARKFEDYDRAFFEQRWSEDWTRRSIEHNRKKWGLGPEDTGLRYVANWTEKHRRLLERSQTPWALHVAPIVARKKIATWLRKRNIIPERDMH